jgi:hypothetical protein
VPYFYKSHQSIETLYPVPNLVSSQNLRDNIATLNSCDAFSDRCCVLLGPIIGRTTPTTARFLFEVSHSQNVSVSLSNIHNATDTHTVSAFTHRLAPQALEVRGLLPDAVYALRYLDCQHPRPPQPEGGHGLVRTKRTDTTAPTNIAVVSCNNVFEDGLRDRHRRHLFQGPAPGSEGVSHYTLPGRAGGGARSLSASSSSLAADSVWGSLAQQAHALDAALHLGDQVYADSDALGPQHHVFAAVRDAWTVYLREAYRAAARAATGVDPVDAARPGWQHGGADAESSTFVPLLSGPAGDEQWAAVAAAWERLALGNSSAPAAPAAGERLYTEGACEVLLAPAPAAPGLYSWRPRRAPPAWLRPLHRPRPDAQYPRDSRLPDDAPPPDVVLARIPCPHVLNQKKLFSAAPTPLSLLAPLLPSSLRHAAALAYQHLYQATWSRPATRLALSRMPNLMLLDDHDVFDDLNDVAADAQPLSLRRAVVDAGMAVYRQYQHQVNGEDDTHSVPLPTALAGAWAAPGPSVQAHLSRLPAGEAALIVGAASHLPRATPVPDWRLPTAHGFFAAALPRYAHQHQRDTPQYLAVISHAFAGTPPAPRSPFPLPAPAPAAPALPLSSPRLPLVPWRTHHFHRIHGVCVLMLDARAARDGPRFGGPHADDDAASTDYLGRRQWLWLEAVLADARGPAPAACHSLVVTASLPPAFIPPAPNAAVGLFHDDMLGHWAGPRFAAEQRRLLRRVLRWRDDDGAEGVPASHPVREVLLVGGDVHSSGHTDLAAYPDRALGRWAVANTQPSGRPPPPDRHPRRPPAAHADAEADAGSAPVSPSSPPLLQLTVSPVANEGLHQGWTYSLMGFAHHHYVLGTPDQVARALTRPAGAVLRCGEATAAAVRASIRRARAWLAGAIGAPWRRLAAHPAAGAARRALGAGVKAAYDSAGSWLDAPYRSVLARLNAWAEVPEPPLAAADMVLTLGLRVPVVLAATAAKGVLALAHALLRAAAMPAVAAAEVLSGVDIARGPAVTDAPAAEDAWFGFNHFGWHNDHSHGLIRIVPPAPAPAAPRAPCVVRAITREVPSLVADPRSVTGGQAAERAYHRSLLAIRSGGAVPGSDADPALYREGGRAEVPSHPAYVEPRSLYHEAVVGPARGSADADAWDVAGTGQASVWRVDEPVYSHGCYKQLD